jgi:hypothetical protein
MTQPSASMENSVLKLQNSMSRNKEKNAGKVGMPYSLTPMWRSDFYQEITCVRLFRLFLVPLGSIPSQNKAQMTLTNGYVLSLVKTRFQL